MSMKRSPMRRKPFKGKYRKKIYIKAHDVARAIWRTVGYCEDCGRKPPEIMLHGAHIFGTGAYPRIGADLRNGLCLCAGCHRKWTNNPEWRTFVLTTRCGKYYQDLLVLGMARDKVDWYSTIETLEELQPQITDKSSLEVAIDDLYNKDF